LVKYIKFGVYFFRGRSLFNKANLPSYYEISLQIKTAGLEPHTGREKEVIDQFYQTWDETIPQLDPSLLVDADEKKFVEECIAEIQEHQQAIGKEKTSITPSSRVIDKEKNKLAVENSADEVQSTASSELRTQIQNENLSVGPPQTIKPDLDLKDAPEINKLIALLPFLKEQQESSKESKLAKIYFYYLYANLAKRHHAANANSIEKIIKNKTFNDSSLLTLYVSMVKNQTKSKAFFEELTLSTAILHDLNKLFKTNINKEELVEGINYFKNSLTLSPISPFPDDTSNPRSSNNPKSIDLEKIWEDYYNHNNVSPKLPLQRFIDAIEISCNIYKQSGRRHPIGRFFSLEAKHKTFIEKIFLPKIRSIHANKNYSLSTKSLLISNYLEEVFNKELKNSIRLKEKLQTDINNYLQDMQKLNNVAPKKRD